MVENIQEVPHTCSGNLRENTEAERGNFTIPDSVADILADSVIDTVDSVAIVKRS